jgi:hypothetical protein
VTEPRAGRIPAVVRDVLLIVLGAALALAAEEWRDARATRHRTAVALASVRAEIAANFQRVERARAHHRLVVDTLLAYQARHAVPSDSLLFSGVFNPAHPLATAWQTARDTRALGDIAYPVALRLGALYEQQEQYREVSTALEESLTARIQSEGVRAAFLDRWANLVFLNQDFAGRAEGLGGRYTATLAFLDSLRVGAPAAP